MSRSSSIPLLLVLILLCTCRRQHGSGDDRDADVTRDAEMERDGDIVGDSDLHDGADEVDADTARDVDVDVDPDADEELTPVDCDAVPDFYEGNDPDLRHECGYACESDWCACDACLIMGGPGTPHPEGRYEVTFYGGPSGTVTFVFAVHDATVGADLVSETTTYSDFFYHTLEFTSPPGCHLLEYRVTSLQDVCSRLYDITVAHGA